MASNSSDDFQKLLADIVTSISKIERHFHAKEYLLEKSERQALETFRAITPGFLSITLNLTNYKLPKSIRYKSRVTCDCSTRMK